MYDPNQQQRPAHGYRQLPYQQPGQPGPQQPSGPWQPPLPRPYPNQVQPKSAGLALLLSLIIPGLGTMYAGEVTWGVVILVMWLLSWAATLVVMGFIALPIVWIASLIAAYQAAQKWNRNHGIIS